MTRIPSDFILGGVDIDLSYKGYKEGLKEATLDHLCCKMGKWDIITDYVRMIRCYEINIKEKKG